MDEKEPTIFVIPLKIIFSLVLTVLLGPGVGHLYLRKYKKGFLLISATLFFALHQAWKVIKNLPPESLQNLTSKNISILFSNFALDFPQTVLMYDIIFAAIWAYALIDAFKISKNMLNKNKVFYL